MKRYQLGIAAFLGLTLVLTGCGKKATDQANLSTDTGFDSLATTEELSQLPQASLPNQQGAIEVLPIETAPVTQSINNAGNTTAAMQEAVSTATGEALSYQQKIQTALKNAGLYTGPIDGKIGPASRKAIETFQKNNSLNVDGKVGPKTWAMLEQYLTGQVAAAANTAQ